MMAKSRLKGIVWASEKHQFKWPEQELVWDVQCGQARAGTVV